MTGMLDTDSPDSGDSPAMEGTGDGYLPDLPVLTHAAEWSMDQVPPDTLTTVLPEDSDQSQDSLEQQQIHQSSEPSDLGSVERAVEQFQLFQEQQQEPTEEVPDAEESIEALKQALEPTLGEGEQAAPVAEDGSPANMELEDGPKEPAEPEEPAVPAEPELPSEFEKLFKGCEDSPDDFNGWVYLLQYVEQEVSKTLLFTFP